MKIVQPKLKNMFFIYAPFALIGILLNIFFPNAIIKVLTGFMPFTFILAIIIILIPFSKQRPLSNSPFIKNKTRYWFGRLILLQLGVMLVFLGFIQAVICYINSNNPDQAVPTLFQQTLNFYQGGLWPWPFILLVSCATAYLGRMEKYPLVLRKAVQPVIKKHADGVIGVGIEIFMKQGLLFVSLITLGILLLQISHIICQLLHLPTLLTFSIHTSLIGILLFIILAKNKFTQILTRRIWQQKCADNKLLLIFCVIALVLLIILNFCFYLIKIYWLPTYLLSIQLPAINKFDNINQWLLLSFIWWIGLMPLLTRAITFITSERSLREILLAGLLLPVLLGAGWGSSGYFAPHVLQDTLAYFTQSPFIGLALGLVSLMITICLFHNPNTADMSSCNKACSPAVQSTVSFLRTLWQLCTYMIAAYLLTNLTFITLFGAALAAPIFATLFSALLGCLIIIITNRKNPS